MRTGLINEVSKAHGGVIASGKITPPRYPPTPRKSESHANEEEEVLTGPTPTWKAGVAEPLNAEGVAEARRELRAEEKAPEPHEAAEQLRVENTPDKES